MPAEPHMWRGRQNASAGPSAGTVPANSGWRACDNLEERDDHEEAEHRPLLDRRIVRSQRAHLLGAEGVSVTRRVSSTMAANVCGRRTSGA